MSAGESSAGAPRQAAAIAFARRAAAWLAWWVLLMGLWVAVDDSIGLAELGAGAGAAALGALLAEVAGHQAATRSGCGSGGWSRPCGCRGRSSGTPSWSSPRWRVSWPVVSSPPAGSGTCRSVRGPER